MFYSGRAIKTSLVNNSGSDTYEQSTKTTTSSKRRDDEQSSRLNLIEYQKSLLEKEHKARMELIEMQKNAAENERNASIAKMNYYNQKMMKLQNVFQNVSPTNLYPTSQSVPHDASFYNM